MDLRSLPKVDLHRHLEGAIRLQTIIDLSREAGEPLAARTPEELAPQAQVLRPMSSLAEVLTYFRVAQEAFRDYAAVERIAFEAVEDLANDNVRLAELRFSPDFMCRPHELEWSGAMEAILAGIDRARNLDVAVGLIAIVSRSYGIESAERTVDFALRHRFYIASFNHLTPFPGTPLYRRWEAEGRLLYERWWLDDNYRYNKIPFQPTHMTPERLQRGCVEARSKFYAWSNIWKRGLDPVNRSHSLMWQHFYGINYLFRREVRQRDDYPLGDEAWRGPLLKARERPALLPFADELQLALNASHVPHYV